MKKLILVIVLLFSFVCLGQEKKETVYLLFDTTSKEKWIVEDGSGNSERLNKYRKGYEKNLIFFYIGNEYFAFNRKRKKPDTCSVKGLKNLKIVDIPYIKKEKSKTTLKYKPFKKIYLIEKISKEKFLKYDVSWIDDWMMVKN